MWSHRRLCRAHVAFVHPTFDRHAALFDRVLLYSIVCCIAAQSTGAETGGGGVSVA
jgi:hypothetical protein